MRTEHTSLALQLLLRRDCRADHLPPSRRGCSSSSSPSSPDESFPEAVRRELSRPRRYWPTDEQLREAIRTRPFYLSGRGPQRKLILERLEQSQGHPEQIDFDNTKLTIEHILPQTLSQEWRDHLVSLRQDPDEVHQRLAHTLGNLTLAAFNGTLSNNPFERKRQIYSGSHLELNRALAEQGAWGVRRSLPEPTNLPTTRSRSGQARSRGWPNNPVALTGAASIPCVHVERPGHGHTADVRGPITYELMDQDTIAFDPGCRSVLAVRVWCCPVLNNAVLAYNPEVAGSNPAPATRK